jgi:hypothetical protein
MNQSEGDCPTLGENMSDHTRSAIDRVLKVLVIVNIAILVVAAILVLMDALK